MVTVDRLLGYTWDQWAILAGIYGRPEIVTIESALEIRKKWLTHYTTLPGETKFVGIEYKKDHEFCAKLFSLPL